MRLLQVANDGSFGHLNCRGSIWAFGGAWWHSSWEGQEELLASKVVVYRHIASIVKAFGSSSWPGTHAEM